MKVEKNIINKVEKILNDSKNIFILINDLTKNSDNKTVFPLDKSLLVKLAICSDTYNELLISLETTKD